MNWVDWIILGVTAASVFAGLMRGAVRTVFSIVGIGVGFWLAARESGAVSMVLARWMPESAAAVTGFLFVFLGIALVFSLVAWLLRKALQGLSLSWLDRLAGAGFGLVRAAAILGVLALAVEGMGGFAPAREAVTYPTVLRGGRLLLGLIPEDTLKRMDWDRLREWIPDADEVSKRVKDAI